MQSASVKNDTPLCACLKAVYQIFQDAFNDLGLNGLAFEDGELLSSRKAQNDLVIGKRNLSCSVSQGP